VDAAQAEIGVLGGSGMYRLLDDVAYIAIETPYGVPSDDIAIGRVGDRMVAFMPRHGRKHTIPPAAINYRANLWALHSIGVTRVIAPTARPSRIARSCARQRLKRPPAAISSLTTEAPSSSSRVRAFRPGPRAEPSRRWAGTR
jgi:hypothetical protein